MYFGTTSRPKRAEPILFDTAPSIGEFRATGQNPIPAIHRPAVRNSSGSSVIFAAIRRASSRVSGLAVSILPPFIL
jgi:hypothetical protein